MRSTVSFIVAAAAALAVPAGAQVQLQLTSASGGGERHPVLALDADVVAYVAMAGGVRELFTVSFDRQPPVRRTNGAGVYVVWSPFDSWPALSISDDGNRIGYWNQAGVHVLDIAANTDTVVAPSSLLPYPQLDGDGSRLVYQAPVAGDMEVFLVSASGGTPRQLTMNSGFGRRLPHIRGDVVLFQKPVNGQQELFRIDLTTGTVSAALTTGSGRGNRYGRLSPDGSSAVYEAVVGSEKEAFGLDLASGVRRALTNAGLRGDRTPVPTGDGEAFLQLPVTNLEVHVADAAVMPLTSGSRAGLRRHDSDRHGHAVVFQAEAAGSNEVFALLRCREAAITTYGSHGTPSVGSLQDFTRVVRCDATFGVRTALAQGTAAVLLLGRNPLRVPLPNAPGNFLFVDPLAFAPLTVPAGGELGFTFRMPAYLVGSGIYAQFALRDPPANPLQVVSTKGFFVDFM